MNLYHLYVTNGPQNYDMYDSFIIRANSSKEARKIASKIAADEGKVTWLTPSLSTCELLSTTGDIGVIVASFNAG